MLSRSPRKRWLTLRDDSSPAALALDSVVAASPPDFAFCHDRATVLGFGGSLSQIARASASGDIWSMWKGRPPVNRTNNTTPSEYTSLTVVTLPPITCSGLA